MPRLVACHFVHSVMDGIEVMLLGQLSQLHLAHGRAVFGFHAHFEVLLGAVGYDLAQKFGKLGGMLGFFKGSLFPVQADFGIALTVRYARHGQVHTHLGALAGEVSAQTFDDFFRRALGYSHNMLGSPDSFFILLRHKLAGRYAALRALNRGLFTFIHITANAANPFHNNLPPLILLDPCCKPCWLAL